MATKKVTRSTTPTPVTLNTFANMPRPAVTVAPARPASVPSRPAGALPSQPAAPKASPFTRPMTPPPAVTMQAAPVRVPTPRATSPIRATSGGPTRPLMARAILTPGEARPPLPNEYRVPAPRVVHRAPPARPKATVIVAPTRGSSSASQAVAARRVGVQMGETATAYRASLISAQRRARNVESLERRGLGPKAVIERKEAVNDVARARSLGIQLIRQKAEFERQKVAVAAANKAEVAEKQGRPAVAMQFRNTARTILGQRLAFRIPPALQHGVVGEKQARKKIVEREQNIAAIFQGNSLGGVNGGSLDGGFFDDIVNAVNSVGKSVNSGVSSVGSSIKSGTCANAGGAGNAVSQGLTAVLAYFQKTPPAGTPAPASGGAVAGLGALPWGRGRRRHVRSGFSGLDGLGITQEQSAAAVKAGSAAAAGFAESYAKGQCRPKAPQSGARAAPATASGGFSVPTPVIIGGAAVGLLALAKVAKLI